MTSTGPVTPAPVLERRFQNHSGFPSPTASRDFVVVVRRLGDVDSSFLEAWTELEQHALAPSPFLSPDFVLPAARYLQHLQSPIFLSVEQGNALMALAICEEVSHSRRLPVRHLRSWQTPHTYCDGLLLRAGVTDSVLAAFWRFLSSGGHDWHGIEFPRCLDGEPMDQWLDASAASAQVMCLRGTSWSRASLRPREIDAGQILQSLSTKRAKSLKRGWRELEKRGQTRFEVQRDPQKIEHCADELMRLEHLGWKSGVGTSLASQECQSQFFRDVIRRANQRGSVFFSRILVGEETIASVANFRYGNTVSCFKLGWDPAFERGCPGFHLLMQSAFAIPAEFPSVHLIDSCSSTGSFIEHLWPQRRQFASRTYVTSPVGALAATMMNGLRWVRDNARSVSRQLLRSSPENLI
jgi:CelD/BcsL family acetyltransferase involved in cellulose biosynthesis